MIEQAIFVSEAAAQEAPSPANVLGLAMGGPVVIAHGTEEQKERYLEPILTAEEIWCQGFSEPESGSDLASLKTRAVKDGDEWVVTGQKVWTTFAQYAKWCMLVARTDPDAPKHQGLTYFLMDMEQEGVEAKPLVQITGEGEFNEVFINEARIPEENVVGGVGNGWGVAITTLMNERAGLAFGAIAQIQNSLGRLARLAQEVREEGGGSAADDAYFRQQHRPAPHRGGDDAAERLPRPDQDDAVGHPRARGLARQVAVGRHQPGDHRAGAGDRGRLRAARPRRRARGRQRRLAVRLPALARQLDRGRHHRHPQEHHRRAGARPAADALRGELAMYFDLNDEQRAIQETAREFLAARFKSERIREIAASEDGIDEAGWSEMAELGWPGLALPEEWGGQGLGTVELAVLFEEMGYALAPSPLFSNTAVGLALAAGGSDEQKESHLRPLAEGTRRGTTGLRRGRLDRDARRLRDGGAGRRRGRRPRRREGARPRRRRRRLLPRRDRRRPPPPGRRRGRRGDGDARKPRSTRPAASPRSASRASRSAPEATLPGHGADWEPVFDVCCVALAAESTGIAQRTLEMAVEYAKDRQQFGRPIGSYQAVSHRCAQMLLETENSRSAVYGAAWAADAEPESLPRAAASAKAYASDAGWRVPDASIQVHGGIGFTWEHDLHFFLKRGRANAALYGDARWHRERVADGDLRRRRRAGARLPRRWTAAVSALERISVAAIGTSVAELEAEALRAEAAGVECVWAPELFRSAVTQAAYLAGKTERIGVATGIVWAFTRSPFIHAVTALDIDEMSGGRFRLGMGAGVKRLNETWHNADYGKPAPHLREAIEATRLIMRQAGAGEPIRYEGEYYDIDIKGWVRPHPPAARDAAADLHRRGPGGDGADGRRRRRRPDRPPDPEPALDRRGRRRRPSRRGCGAPAASARASTTCRPSAARSTTTRGGRSRWPAARSPSTRR